MFDRQENIDEIKKCLHEMKKIASCENSGKSLVAFPPPNGERFITLSENILDIMDYMAVLKYPKNTELSAISQLKAEINRNLREHNEEACYPLCEEMTKKMREYIAHIEAVLPNN